AVGLIEMGETLSYNRGMADPKPTDPQLHADALLQRAKLKRTPVRIGVLKVLAESESPLDVVDLLKQLPAFTEPVTVYRTLTTFVAKKLVHRVRGTDRSWRYAMGDQTKHADHQHAHFVCDDCGRMECVEDAKVPAKLLEKVHAAPGYRVKYPEVLLHGICPKCQ
ncbi:MAG: Fur family transcriptional regulator, partial [Tepidisphaeraceae bacterium]